MTKTLTEQWREGTLGANCYYYIKTKWLGCDKKWHFNKEVYIDFLYEDGDWSYTICECVKEVLAPVPSYDEHNELKQDNKYLKSGIETRDKQIEQLEKRLAIATKALERYSKDDYYSEGGGRSVNPYPHIARKALKEMEGVK